MAYYINKKNQQKQQQQENSKPGQKNQRLMKSFYQLVGAGIVLIIFMIIWFVRTH